MNNVDAGIVDQHNTMHRSVIDLEMEKEKEWVVEMAKELGREKERQQR